MKATSLGPTASESPAQACPTQRLLMALTSKHGTSLGERQEELEKLRGREEVGKTWGVLGPRAMCPFQTLALGTLDQKAAKPGTQKVQGQSMSWRLSKALQWCQGKPPASSWPPRVVRSVLCQASPHK